MEIPKKKLAIVISIIAVTAVILLLMGRVPWCDCGYVKLWHGEVMTSENSQHITDWYTFSHIIHGLVFYWILSLLAPGLPIWTRLILAVLPEAGWEIFENTDFIINRYRETTIALDYYGDSVINSVSDILAMIGGFLFARKFPVWASIALIVFLELLTLYFIRDNLILNIIMLVHPVPAIKAWQGM